MTISSHTIKDFSDIHGLQKPAFLYRGQPRSEWNLSPSLQRLFEGEATPRNYRVRLEPELLREFKRGYHGYAANVPAPNATIEWLSLMQHHGAPTRLLDFTYSIYIAAYFAFETADPDNKKDRQHPALWMVDGDWALGKCLSIFRKTGKLSRKECSVISKSTSEECEPIWHECLFEKPAARFAIPVVPFRLGERLRTQKSVFLAPGDATRTMMENLEAMPGHDNPAHVLKLELAMSRRRALEKLHGMNISRTSLFPGLDGYARSLGVHHFSYDPKNHWPNSRPVRKKR